MMTAPAAFNTCDKKYARLIRKMLCDAVVFFMHLRILFLYEFT
jgi:hypothetical protein